MLNRLRAFLREQEYGDFSDGDEFARVLLDELDIAWERGWASKSVKGTIATTGKQIYEYYRLTDTTVFSDESPIRLRLGGPDKASIKFIGKLDHFYFSKFADNTREPMRKFFVEQYFENGDALFGRESTDELQAFRKASGDRFKNLTDRQVLTIVQTAVQRTRNWAHIGTLNQNGDEWAKLVATLDAKTTPLCEFLDGKLFRIGVAQKAIERLNQLEPAEFALQLYASDLNKKLQKNPVDTLKQYLEEGGQILNDELTQAGRSFPPFHPNCRTRLRGLVVGIDEIPKNDDEE